MTYDDWKTTDPRDRDRWSDDPDERDPDERDPDEPEPDPDPDPDPDRTDGWGVSP